MRWGGLGQNRQKVSRRACLGYKFRKKSVVEDPTTRAGTGAKKQNHTKPHTNNPEFPLRGLGGRKKESHTQNTRYKNYGPRVKKLRQIELAKMLEENFRKKAGPWLRVQDPSGRIPLTTC